MDDRLAGRVPDMVWCLALTALRYLDVSQLLYNTHTHLRTSRILLSACTAFPSYSVLPISLLLRNFLRSHPAPLSDCVVIPAYSNGPSALILISLIPAQPFHFLPFNPKRLCVGLPWLGGLSRTTSRLYTATHVHVLLNTMLSSRRKQQVGPEGEPRARDLSLSRARASS